MLAALAVAMALGIALADATGGDPRAAWLPGLLGMASLSRRSRRAAGALLLAFAAGWSAMAERRAEAREAAARPPIEATVEAVVAARSGAWNPRRLGLAAARGAGAARLHLFADVPEALDPWLPGDRLRARLRLAPLRRARNPGDEWGGARDARAGIGLAATPAHPALIVARPSSARGVVHAWRRRAARRLATGGPGSDLLRGLALGDREAIDPQRRRAFVRLGLAHALAVSGLHLAWVAAAVYGIARLGLGRLPGLAARRDPRRAALWVAALAALLYAALAGFGVPVRRALCLLLAAALAIARRRPGTPASALGAAALWILSREPDALFQPGAQLSFAAVAGLVASPRTRRADAARAALARFGEAAVSRSTTAILATAPVLAWHGGGVSSLALPANALVLPWLGVAVLPLALTAAIAAGCGAPGWEGLVRGAAWLADRTGRALDVAGGALPSLERARPGPGPGLAILAASALGLVARGPVPRGLAALVLAALFAFAPAVRVTPDPPRLVALDVGQGDAVLVQGVGATLLVDGGGAWSGWDAGRRRVLPALRALGVERLDLVIASHADLDHRGGLPAILEAVPVSELWLPWEGRDDPDFAPLLRAAREAGARVREVGEGSPIRRLGALRVAPLWPRRGSSGSRNARSLVVRIEAEGGHRVLLPGDLDAEAERRLAARTSDLRAEVLLLSHHGSRSSSSEVFLAAVAPRLAIASAPCRGRFGMPHPAVRARLAARAVPLGWTGRDGALRVPLRGPLRMRGTGPPARCP